jgi:hypothetical protein
VDELYARDGTCETGPAYIAPVFGHFTALPLANDYLAFEARDGRGGVCFATVQVCVPHDRARSSAGCGDQGPRYDSTGADDPGPH